ncbi:MAG TPA: sulfatase [Bacteroidales bacterium]|nr:sulfatase [Bacteroidales bacterium]
MEKRCDSMLLASLLCAPVLLSAVSCSSGDTKPNFIILIADDVSWDDIGCYGNNQVKTPNIDRLAASGLKFNNFFLTASSSSPSRNSIITGRYPHNTGGAELHTEPPEFMISFPEILKMNGYYSAQAGKFHMGDYARRGFDLIKDREGNGDGGEEQWIKCLKERPPEKPFFFWFAAYDAHRPWGPNDLSGTHAPEDVIPPLYLAQGEWTKMDLASYYDEIARFDSYVGFVFEELEKQNVADNTFIIIMADNGRPFPHSKTRVNDRGLRSPFIAYWPGGLGTRAKVCNSLVSSIDIAPTILSIAGLEIPESVQGVSFKKLLKNPAMEFRNYVFAEHNWHDYEAHERMVRTRDFLYIFNSRPQYPQMGPADAIGSLSFLDLDSLRKCNSLTKNQSDIFIAPRENEELFDCLTGPDQFDNIAGSIEHKKELDQLRTILKEWMEVTGDNVPENLTKDWYEKLPGYIKTESFNIRGEPVDKKYNATQINTKGRF